MNRTAEYDIFHLAQAMTDTSNGHLLVVHHEADDSPAAEPEAAHFLKMDGMRLGRDLELYRFMGQSVMSWPTVIAILVLEILLPLKKVAPASYEVGRDILLEWGKTAYTPEDYAQFQGLF